MLSVTLLSKYLDLAEVFSEKTSNTLSKYGPQDLALETLGVLLFGLVYNLSQIKFKVL